MKPIIFEMAYKSKDFGPDNISYLEVQLTKDERRKISKAMEVCRKSGYWSINLFVNCSIRFLNKDHIEATEWRSGIDYWIIYPDSALLFSQSKHDHAGTLYVESETFRIDQDLNISFPNREEV